MNPDIQKDIEQYLETTVYESQIVNGGDINDTFLLKTQTGEFFLKTNSVDFAHHMFATEAKGLNRLAATNAIRTPKIIAKRFFESQAYLLLEYIPPGTTSTSFWENFGNALARLHQHSAATFGLDHSNYIGKLSQSNNQHNDWPSFYIEERLIPQIKLAADKNLLNVKTQKRFDSLFSKLNSLCPNEVPALIHGDLWNGNYLIDSNGEAILIDPSVSFAHREMDIAMTHLFGGFPSTFYKAYQSTFPLESGFEKRIEIYQLYYLIVHVNLFGGSYLNAVKRVLDKFC